MIFRSAMFPACAVLMALALATCLAGCSKQLLGSLDEMAANQVVSVLRLEGISSDKTTAGEKGWKVTVPDDQFADAVQLLDRLNLPAQQFQGLGQVFKKESLVSTPTEERARLMYAMSQELEHSLMQIDGVLAARVHPVILLQDPLNPKRSAATASVLIKYRVGTDVNGRESMARALVAAGIEGLNYDDVRVVMVPGEARPAESARRSAPGSDAGIPNANPGRTLGHLLSPSTFAGIAVAVAGTVALSLLWTRLRRRSAETLRGRWQHTINSMFVEPGRSNGPAGPQ